MRNILSLAFLLFVGTVEAQIPNGYYDDAQGLTGYELKTALSEITGVGYSSQSYSALWGFFAQYDKDKYYENDGTLLDMYSEDPNGPDPYNYTVVSGQCGNYAQESDCYNREHMMPKSWFNGAMPMKTDIHHIYPTDGYVNGQHSNLPLGEIQNPTYTSQNGSKKGPNSYNYPGAYTGIVFEPIDEFKGDVARAYLYMVTRYEDQVASWRNSNSGSLNTFNGTSDQAFNDWTIDMLLKWSDEDPVSQREIDRNNAAYQFQGNRNPYIDHPEYVNMIWGDGSSTQPGDDDYVYYEDFNDCQTVSDNFIAVSEMSSQDWECVTAYGENNTGAMQMNAFANNQQVPSRDWLITTNTINFDNYTDEKLSFYAESTFGKTSLQLLYSTDYDGGNKPSDFTWIPVPNVSIPDYPAGESDPVENVFIDVDISGIEGTQVYLAFKYDNSNGEDATRWTVDSFKITSEEMGVDEHKDSDFLLYPNPTSNTFVITTKSSLGETLNYQIFDLQGRMIKEGQSTDNREEVNVSELESGLYLVKLKAGRQTITKRLVIEN